MAVKQFPGLAGASWDEWYIVMLNAWRRNDIYLWRGHNKPTKDTLWLASKLASLMTDKNRVDYLNQRCELAENAMTRFAYRTFPNRDR